MVRALVGIQAQDRGAALLAVRARGPGLPAAAVEDALAGGAIERLWAMRGTLHLLAAGDVPLALAVFGPLYVRRGAPRLTALGLPPALAERSTREAAAVLAEEGPLTRGELAERLRRRGVPVAADGQAAVHVVRRASFAGVLREAGTRAGRPLYARREPVPLPARADALRELARRYAAAHAPASAADFAAWSGLPAADVRAAWAGAPPPAPPDADAPAGPVRLLPAWDEWLLGWASRDWTLPRPDARRAVPGGGLIRPVAIDDGRVFATWRLDRPGRRIAVEPFAPLTRRRGAGLEREAAAVGAFLGQELALDA